MLFTAIICFCIQLASLATKPSELAMCLLQRNTLDTVLGCTDWKKNWHEGKYVYWPVTKYSVSDGMDLMPVSSGGVYDDAEIDNFDVEDDGMLKVTPRGLLIAAAEMTH
ncbi:hypothetical protein GQ607_008850 [Colletotrichum asianum]|uniref:Uncharacterized protein n=1 Tax=Colletotrichum asianum TaxID=702518 RepID=A0A8H3W9L4_9PEZI|nr:hypothetical protein GQ607_008850 [Colletotrichum asianum]